MNNCTKVLAGLAILLSSTGAIAQKNYMPPRTDLPSEVQRQVNLSYLMANGELDPDYLPTLFAGLFGTPRQNVPLVKADHTHPVVGQAFDNLYFVGFASVGTWALKTSAGIILFDTLNNSDEAEHVLIPGLRRLGLDPAEIKYVVVTHGHYDHIGGARYLQDHYHARILMGRADWDMVEQHPGSGPRAVPLPKRDISVDDGYVLTLGDTSVTLYVTPGHTPSTLSTLIKTSWHGKSHVVAFWGGNGMPTTLEPTATSGGLVAYRSSLVRFTRLGIDSGVDAVISNHPIVDGTVRKVAQISANPAGADPWVVGTDRFIRVMGSNIAAIDAGIAAAELKKK